MAAQEDSLLSPITAAADHSESTTLLVVKVSFLLLFAIGAVFKIPNPIAKCVLFCSVLDAGLPCKLRKFRKFRSFRRFLACTTS
jgi:hypothetical protein